MEGELMPEEAVKGPDWDTIWARKGEGSLSSLFGKPKDSAAVHDGLCPICGFPLDNFKSADRAEWNPDKVRVWCSRPYDHRDGKCWFTAWADRARTRYATESVVAQG